MIAWKHLSSLDQLQSVIETSRYVPVVIYNHNPQCAISSIVEKRLEIEWDLPEDVVEFYYLDVLAYPKVAEEVELIFEVGHESPQILLICDGISVYDASHSSISMERIKDLLDNVESDAGRLCAVE